MSSFAPKMGKVSFQTQGRLLQELGERLVAKADVALMELIKNAYDADASECVVKYDGKTIRIQDDGHGMTEQEFKLSWMHIATESKQRKRQSQSFQRRVTGSKGIGRFAVRFLGRFLTLETIACDTFRGKAMTLLKISFDWARIDSAKQLHTVKIPYEVRPAPSGSKPGTTLIIGRLRNPKDINFNKSMRTELLSIVNPFSGLDSGGFTRKGESDEDPGFRVLLPGNGEEETDLTSAVTQNAYARLKIEHKGNRVLYLVKHKDGRVLLRRSIEFESHISMGFFADICYCPRRAGMFQNTQVDGRVVYSWLRENGGIGIVDHGFRIRPYGFQDDDWLNLSLDSGHNRRDWRTAFMSTLFPMPKEASSQPRLNPMLYLPNFHQLVGAVFVESSQDLESERPTDLTSAMDREGFIDNEAFRDLSELVRAGLEMLAYADHKEQRRLEKEAAQRAAEEMREDFHTAISFVETIPTLSESDKTQIIQRFHVLSEELDSVEDYHRVAASRMEMVGLLGVLAGFLTHEMKRLIHDLDRIIEELSPLEPGPLAEVLERVRRTREEIRGQVEFAATYVANVQSPQEDVPLNAKSQAMRICDRFRFFTDDRNVSVYCEIDEDLMTPKLPVTLYSGVLLNLFSNALKAVFGGQGALGEPKVAIKAWNEPRWHVVEVADTGVGIPPNLEKRIWDPLFTTTSGGSSNPLGSGMGLGLSLVKRLMSEAKGRIELVDAPPGYNTCFRAQFRRNLRRNP